VQGICLDEQPMEVLLTQELFEPSPLVVFTSGIAGLTNRHTQLRRIEGHMGNERRTAAGDGFYWPALGFSIADKVGEGVGGMRGSWRCGGQLPGVNYLDGSRQLRRRVPPLSPPAMAGGGDTDN
jgi:hypothetical protein